MAFGDGSVARKVSAVTGGSSGPGGGSRSVPGVLGIQAAKSYCGRGGGGGGAAKGAPVATKGPNVATKGVLWLLKGPMWLLKGSCGY